MPAYLYDAQPLPNFSAANFQGEKHIWTDLPGTPSIGTWGDGDGGQVTLNGFLESTIKIDPPQSAALVAGGTISIRSEMESRLTLQTKGRNSQSVTLIIRGVPAGF